MDSKQKLEELIKKRITQEEAFSFYDTLDTVELSMMKGLWKGRELRTGHPMEGLLDACKWYGKRFEDIENVHPLVFLTSKNKLFYGNPGLLPLKLPIEKLPNNIISILFSILSPFIRTKKSKARLRMIEYRGKISASMPYDQLAIIDIFRKVDENTVVGIMDFKENPSSKSYFFVLERVNR